MKINFVRTQKSAQIYFVITLGSNRVVGALEALKTAKLSINIASSFLQVVLPMHEAKDHHITVITQVPLNWILCGIQTFRV